MGPPPSKTFWWISNVLEWIILHFITIVAFTSFQTVHFTSNRNLVRGAVIDSNILGFGQDSRFDSWFISRAIRLILIGSAEMTHSPLPYFSSKPSFWAQSFTFTKLESLIPKTDFWFSINKISDNLCVSIDRTTAIASSRIYTSITLVSSAAIRKLGNIWNRDLPYHTQYLEIRTEINGISMLSLREKSYCESGLQIVDLACWSNA